jgi:AraC-like DNA-binding protein
MKHTLLTAVNGFTATHCNANGITQTSIPGLAMVRATSPGEIQHAIYQPLMCLVLQGTKHVMMGSNAFTFSAGESLLITADVPIVSQILRATEEEPYLSLVMDLDLSLIADLSAHMNAEQPAHFNHVQVEPTDIQVARAALRMVELLDHPAAITLLSQQLVREIHYWLLVGQHGNAIRQLSSPDSALQRITRSVKLLRYRFKESLTMNLLAAEAGMSLSSFYHHFRTVTSLSPLQFQKQLRLIEARRLMLSEGITASNAAYNVGYESASQFTREYGRMFGMPPSREIESAKIKTKQHAG